MKLLAATLCLVACSSRESKSSRPAEVPLHAGSSAEVPRDGGAQRVDHDRVILPDWKPPPDVVSFNYGDRELYIDKTEVTVKAYRECVQAGVCTEPGPDAILRPYREAPEGSPYRELPKEERCPLDQFNWAHPDRDDHPVNCVTFWQAWRYCKFRGMRLPIDWEWKAAAGWEYPGNGQPHVERKYPWGDAPVSCDRAVIATENKKAPGCATGHTMPVGSKPHGATPTGILDLIGNVNEIIMPEAHSAETDRYLSSRGGSFTNSIHSVGTIGIGGTMYPGATVGFRCLAWPPKYGRDIADPIRNDAP